MIIGMILIVDCVNNRDAKSEDLSYATRFSRRMPWSKLCTETPAEHRPCNHSEAGSRGSAYHQRL